MLAYEYLYIYDPGLIYLANSQLKPESSRKAVTGGKPTREDLILRDLSSNISKCEHDSTEDHELE
jgi:hypothetical protein